MRIGRIKFKRSQSSFGIEAGQQMIAVFVWQEFEYSDNKEVCYAQTIPYASPRILDESEYEEIHKKECDQEPNNTPIKTIEQALGASVKAIYFS